MSTNQDIKLCLSKVCTYLVPLDYMVCIVAITIHYPLSGNDIAISSTKFHLKWNGSPAIPTFLSKIFALIVKKKMHLVSGPIGVKNTNAKVVLL